MVLYVCAVCICWLYVPSLSTGKLLDLVMRKDLPCLQVFMEVCVGCIHMSLSLYRQTPGPGDAEGPALSSGIYGGAGIRLRGCLPEDHRHSRQTAA